MLLGEEEFHIEKNCFLTCTAPMFMSTYSILISVFYMLNEFWVCAVKGATMYKDVPEMGVN